MAITRESILGKLGSDDQPDNAERRERLFRLTRAWPEARGRSARSSQPIGPIIERIQDMNLDLTHLRTPIQHSIEAE
jgi:hypothetical protein